jgi:hypothetical protein
MLETNQGLYGMLHLLTHGHPVLSTLEIAERLFGVDKLESKCKKLCRKVNPDDDCCHLNPNELIRLMAILNEGLPPERRDEAGGDSVVHWINKKFGFVAVRRPEPTPEATVETLRKALATVSRLQEVIVKAILELANGDLRDDSVISSAATTFVAKADYDAKASLHELGSLIAEMERRII